MSSIKIDDAGMFETDCGHCNSSFNSDTLIVEDGHIICPRCRDPL